jgi:outer membrane protein OmpA-like peptidoglycan-associated protein
MQKSPKHGAFQRPPLRAGATALVIALSLSSVGCETMQTINPFTGEKQVSNTAKGAGIGAAGGAVAGVLIGDNRKATLIGAGIGALAGAGVGYYMDQQEAKLREQLQGTGVSVTRVGDQVVLNMPGNVTFATNSADVSAGFYPVLNSVALVVKKYSKTYVDVIGNTDSTGSADYNQRLSERRALSVSRYLESQGVQPVRLATRGLGESTPIASNDTPDGRSLNRRVEIVLTPLT